MTNQAHRRIDEGVKRGKRPKPSKTTLEGSGRVVSVALRPLHNLSAEERHKVANSVLDRYINGEQVSKMAPEFGVSDVTIYALLLREHESAWKDIQTARALARLESAQDRLEHSQDALSLARARESVRSAQWELERLLSRLYAQKQEINQVFDHRITIEHSLADSALELLNHARGVALQPPIEQVQQVEDKEK